MVQPLDEQRIESIFVNGIEAKMTGENKYSISVSPNLDGTGTIKITTKDDLEMFEGYVLMKKYNKNHHMDI